MPPPAPTDDVAAAAAVTTITAAAAVAGTTSVLTAAERCRREVYSSICRRPAVSGLSRHPAPFCAVEAQHERWRGVCGAEPHNQWRVAIRGLSVVGWRRIPSFRRREATPLVISSSCGVTRHPGRGTAGVRGERRVVVERAHLGRNPRTVLGTVQSRAAASRTWRERRILVARIRGGRS